MFRIVLLLSVIVHGIESKGSCFSYWKLHNDSCYSVFHYEKVGWLLAAATCNVYGGQLAEIYSQELEQWLVSQLTANNIHVTSAWIGGLSRGIGEWIWVPSGNKFTSYRNFKKGEPDNEYHDRCLELHIEHGVTEHWNSKKCTALNSFICQKKPTKGEGKEDSEEESSEEDKKSF